jgi:hypothetical protein
MLSARLEGDPVRGCAPALTNVSAALGSAGRKARERFAGSEATRPILNEM